MIFLRKAFLSALVYLTVFHFATLSAQGPVDQGLIEGARPVVEELRDGLYVMAPEINKLVVMNVRVYNNSGETVLDVQSYGEMVDLQAIDLPDGKYRYHANTVFELDEPSISNGIEEREAISRTVGQFRIQNGKLLPGDFSRFEESTSMSKSIMEGATSLLAWALSVVVEDAVAFEVFSDFIKIEGGTPNIFFNDTDSNPGSLVEWEIIATSSEDNTSGRWALYDWVGTAYPQSDPVIIIDTVENSAIVNSFIIGSNGDLSWGNMGMWFDRSQQDLALGSSNTPRDFNIYDVTPDILLHDESDTSEVVIQQSDGTLIFWGRPTSAGDPASGEMMTMDTSAPTGSLAIEASGHLSAVQGASIGTEINTVGTILSIGNSGSSRAQMEFIDTGGSAFIEWGQSGNVMQFEGPSLLTTVEFDLDAPEFSLMLNEDGKIGMGTSAPEADIHIKHANGTAKILVEETSGIQGARTLFEIKNKGNPEFRMTNSGNSNSWVFSAGQRFVVKNNAGDWVSRTTASGDMEITGVLTESSDVNGKQDIEPVDGRDVLEKLANLEVSEWSYKDAPTDRHVGPMAQDFYAAFGLGHTDKGIATLDTSGVALAAIKALIEDNTALKEQNLSMELRVIELEQQNQRIEELVIQLVSNQAEQVALN